MMEWIGNVMMRYGAMLILRARAEELRGCTVDGMRADWRISITWHRHTGEMTARLQGVPSYIWRHVKRDTTYDVEYTEARVQSDTPLKDGDKVIVYVAHKDNSAWVRPPSEFYDGRFVMEPRGE